MTAGPADRRSESAGPQLRVLLRQTLIEEAIGRRLVSPQQNVALLIKWIDQVEEHALNVRLSQGSHDDAFVQVPRLRQLADFHEKSRDSEPCRINAKPDPVESLRLSILGEYCDSFLLAVERSIKVPDALNVVAHPVVFDHQTLHQGRLGNATLGFDLPCGLLPQLKREHDIESRRQGTATRKHGSGKGTVGSDCIELSRFTDKGRGC